ncbi:hypothetical protein CVT26_001488 [Gymnopilus dilepis]|uniref:Uncharacterized protein n=1 Tax=Gymnopilus dilepis TaxID=231916 RepID=A0A409WE94_9AGAR|nr:hypothetical protein CVT26_001488 [Gymnopilus dilepis]
MATDIVLIQENRSGWTSMINYISNRGGKKQTINKTGWRMGGTQKHVWGAKETTRRKEATVKKIEERKSDTTKA